MKRKRYTEEQIAFSLRQHESGTPVGGFPTEVQRGNQATLARALRELGHRPFHRLRRSSAVWVRADATVTTEGAPGPH